MEGIGKSELIYGDFLQSGDVLVCSWYERKGEGSELHWMIGAFDLSSGEMALPVSGRRARLGDGEGLIRPL